MVAKTHKYILDIVSQKHRRITFIRAPGN